MLDVDIITVLLELWSVPLPTIDFDTVAGTDFGIFDEVGAVAVFVDLAGGIEEDRGGAGAALLLLL